jgi:hypothetical protein
MAAKRDCGSQGQDDEPPFVMTKMPVCPVSREVVTT